MVLGTVLFIRLNSAERASVPVLWPALVGSRDGRSSVISGPANTYKINAYENNVL